MRTYEGTLRMLAPRRKLPVLLQWQSGRVCLRVWTRAGRHFTHIANGCDAFVSARARRVFVCECEIVGNTTPRNCVCGCADRMAHHRCRRRVACYTRRHITAAAGSEQHKNTLPCVLIYLLWLDFKTGKLRMHSVVVDCRAMRSWYCECIDKLNIVQTDWNNRTERRQIRQMVYVAIKCIQCKTVYKTVTTTDLSYAYLI